MSAKKKTTTCRRAGKKRATPTRRELEDRVERCIDLMIDGYHPGEIKKTMAKEYGVSPKTVKNYMTRARRTIIERDGMTRQELQAVQIARYEAALREVAKGSHQWTAICKRIDELKGLEEPKRTELSGVGGGPIQHDVKAERERRHRLMKDPEAFKALSVLAKKMSKPDGSDEDENDN